MSIETYQAPENGIAHHQPPNHTPAVRPRTVVRLTEWAESAMAAHQVAESLVRTSFVPEAFRNKPHEATAAILAGDEVGLSPMASLRAFDIIQGTAAPRAITHRAVVQSRGHEVWQVEATDTRAIFCGRRVGSNVIQESVWTIERARQLGLTGKHNWKAQPKAMLIARATSEVCRLVAADALMGMPYSIEELDDCSLPEQEPQPQQQPDQPIDTPAPARTTKRRAQPRAITPPAERPEPPSESAKEPHGPPLPGEDDLDDLPTPSVGHGDADPVTKTQLTKLHTVFSKGGVDNRDTRLQACSLIIGRELTSSTDLTKQEAMKLIDELEHELDSDTHSLAEFVTDLLGREENNQS